MIFCGDYHTHSTISFDGKGTIRDNLLSAKTRGLKELGATDHGFSDFRCYNREKLKKAKIEVEKLREDFPDFRLLLGTESDLVGLNGEIDLPRDLWNDFDINLLGFHIFTRPKDVQAFFKMHVAYNIDKIFAPSKERVARNTRYLIKALIDNPIHMVSHLNYNINVDAKEVAKCCYDYGILIELNIKHLDRVEPVMDELLASPVGLVANTDSHNPSSVGDFAKILPIVTQYNLTEKKLLNLGNTVIFPRMEQK